MSENFENLATCSVCGRTLENCTCSTEQKANRKILIEHKFTGTPQKPVNQDSEVERLRKENQELNNIIALNAEKEFESEKAQVVAQFPEERREEIENLIGENPDRLEEIKTQLILNPIVQDSGSRRAPKGKAGLQTGDIFSGKSLTKQDEFRQLIDELYQTKNFNPNPVEREKANDKIEELFEQIEQGARANRNVPKMPKTTACIKCGAVLVDSPDNPLASNYMSGRGCGVCGWNGKGDIKKGKGLWI